MRGDSTRRRIAIAVIGAAPILSSCSEESAQNRPTVEETRPSLLVGSVIDAFRAPCSDGEPVVVAPPYERQLITILGPDECESCDRHIAALDTLLRQNPGTRHIFVDYVPVAMLRARSRAQSVRWNSRVCFDTAGSVWNKHVVGRTPVTAVLDGGKVAYITRTLGTLPRSEAQLLRAMNDS